LTRTITAVALSATLLVASTGTTRAAVLAGWDVNSLPGGASNYGPSPFPATTLDPNLTVVGWTRNTTLTTGGSGAARAWGATGWCVGGSGGTCSSPPTTEAAAIAAGAFVTSALTANAGYKVSFTSISRFNYRRSSTGPASGELQYQVGAGTFTDIAPLSYPVTTSTGGAIAPPALDLSGIPALQNVPAGTPVTFRVVNWNASNSGGTWYVWDGSSATPGVSDFEIQGTVTRVATQVGVETTASGTGGIVPAQTIVTGDSITAYAVTRDAGNLFVANSPATWSLTSVTGDVAASDLVPSSDGKSAVFTAHGAGSAVIHAAISGLVSSDSGVIAVQGLPSPPTATGQAVPPTLSNGDTVLLEVGVVPGANPTSTGIAVKCDLSAIGGGGSVSFHDDGQDGDLVAGDNIFSYRQSIPDVVAGGAKSIPISVHDAQGRSGTTTAIAMKVVGAIAILHVNDTHARVTPHKWIVPSHDWASPAFEDVGGAASMATAILQLATANPNALVIDAGDISEGNPIGDMGGNHTMTQFYGLLSTKLTMVQGRNGRGMDAVVVGNHDVRNADYITHLMELQSAGVPVISANVRDIATHQPHFAASTTVTINGTKVGILGYTTQAAEVGADLASTVEIVDCDWNSTDATKIHLSALVKDLRDNQHCDIVVLAAHVGHTAIATDTGSTSSPVAALLEDDGTTKLPEVAVTGHWHTWAETVWQPASLNYKTIFTEAGSYMKYVGELQVTGLGRYRASNQHVIRNNQYAPDSDVQSLIASLTSAYAAAHPNMPVDKVLGYTADNLMLDNDMKWWSSDEYPWNGNNTAGQWICDAMQWKAAQLFGDCDLAIEAGGGVRSDIPAGPVTFTQVYETFPWADDVFYRIDMTGQEVVNFLAATNCDAGFSRDLHVLAHDGMPVSVTFKGAPIELTHTYHVAINNYMYAHPPTGWTWADRSPLSSTVLCRDGIVDYMQQFTQAEPYSVGGARYDLDTEFAGQYRAVVTMMNDTDKPSYQDAFIRFLTATPETLIRRGSHQVPADLVNVDGTVNPEHRLAEQELYRSYLGFKTGALVPGDIIEVRGKGSFYGGNPEFVDQEGIYADGMEFNIVGHDASLAKPSMMSSIGSFWNDNHKNHYVQFLARKAGTDTVADQYGATIKLWDATGYASKTAIPGSIGDLLLVTGITTMESYALRFRCNMAELASAHGITGFPPASTVLSQVEPMTTDNAGGAATVATEASTSSTIILTPVADAQVASGKPTVNYGTSQNIYLQSASTTVSSFGNERGWLRFDLTGLPSDKVVTQATLQMFCWKTAGPGMDVSVHGGADDGWTESAITYGSEPGFGVALDTRTLATGATDVWYGWDVTSWVQNKWAGNRLVSLLLKPTNEGSTASPAPSYAFDAREYGAGMPILRLVLQSPAVTVTGTQVYYRYSADNSTWGTWTEAPSGTTFTGALNFGFPDGYGYYEFYSVATDSQGHVESAPAAAQASVHHGPAPAYSTAAIVLLGNLAQVYDGTPRTVAVSTYPPNLANTLTYDGSADVPIHAGSYAVTTTVHQPGFSGNASGTLVVGKAGQSITFPALAAVSAGASPFAVTASASSGLPVTLSSRNTAVATVSGTTVTVVGPGSTTITASQAGDGDHLAAADVDRDLVVTAAPAPAVPAMPVWALMALAVTLVIAGGAKRRPRGTSA
jgi:2',3'-cyclic-nucleotide 2'-phosphodiesterase / 3'-nucleotidase / 5'-nucleotidase